MKLETEKQWTRDLPTLVQLQPLGSVTSFKPLHREWPRLGPKLRNPLPESQKFIYEWCRKSAYIHTAMKLL